MTLDNELEKMTPDELKIVTRTAIHYLLKKIYNIRIIPELTNEMRSESF